MTNFKRGIPFRSDVSAAVTVVNAKSPYYLSKGNTDIMPHHLQFYKQLWTITKCTRLLVLKYSARYRVTTGFDQW